MLERNSISFNNRRLFILISPLKQKQKRTVALQNISFVKFEFSKWLFPSGIALINEQPRSFGKGNYSSLDIEIQKSDMNNICRQYTLRNGHSQWIGFCCSIRFSSYFKGTKWKRISSVSRNGLGELERGSLHSWENLFEIGRFFFKSEHCFHFQDF